jgi:chorismate dehydratase
MNDRTLSTANPSGCNGPLASPVRLGAISFINTLPIYQGLQSTADLTLNYQPPATLNELMLQGELDVSPVSSAFYLAHTEKFTRLDNLSVSSYGSVDSVLFLSKEPLKNLLPTCPTIAVPDDSATSVQLLRYLLKQQLGESIDDRLVTYPAEHYLEALKEHGCGLIIGDRALMAKLAIENDQLASQSEEMRLIHQHCAHWHVYDLSNGWVEQTGYPIVFAVWVAQRQFAQDHPDIIESIETTLVHNQRQFFKNEPLRQRALAQAQESLPLPDTVLLRYWQHSLNYGWSPEHDASLACWQRIIMAMDSSDFNQQQPLSGALSL